MEKHTRKRKSICPLCGKTYHEAPAQSRKDKRSICPECGLKEAMEDMGMNDAQKAWIMNAISNHINSRKGINNSGK